MKFCGLYVQFYEKMIPEMAVIPIFFLKFAL